MRIATSDSGAALMSVIVALVGGCGSCDDTAVPAGASGSAAAIADKATAAGLPPPVAAQTADRADLSPFEKAPAGQSKKGEPLLLVEAVSAWGDGRDLHFLASVTDDVPAFMKAHKRTSPPVELLIDSDNVRATGGREWATPIASGFEYRVELKVGNVFRRPDGGREVGFGAYPSGPGMEIEGPVLSANAWRQIEGRAPDPLFGGVVVGGLDPETKKRSRVAGREMELAIPYARLGLTPGQVVRVTAKRNIALGGLRERYFSEALLRLR